MPLFASVAVIVVLVGGFAYYYVTATGTIASLNSSITSQQGVISDQASTMSAQSSTIQSQSSNIVTLRANVTAYAALVVSLHALITSDTATIAKLNANLTADTTAIAGLNSQIAGLNSQITTASALIANLTTTVDLQASHILINNQVETIYGNTVVFPSPYISFNPNHAGYILLQVSQATQTWYPETDYAPTASNPNGGVYATFTFLAVSSASVSYVIVPVVPGMANSFFLWSSTSTSGTATVLATYFY